MSHNIDWLFLTAVMIYTIVATGISIVSLNNYKKGIHALDYLIIYFIILAITGIMQFLTPFLHDRFIFFGLYKGTSPYWDIIQLEIRD